MIVAFAVIAMAMWAPVRAHAYDASDPWAIAPAVRFSAVTGTTIPTSIAERGAAARLRLQFSSKPIAPVDVLLLSDGQVAADLPRRTVLAEHWSAGVEFTVAAIADGLLEGAHHGTLRVQTQSQDPDYDGLVVAPLEFDVVDADRASVVIEPAPVELAEGDGPVTVRVRLGAMPAANVAVQLHADPAQFQLSRTTLSFTPATWDHDQLVTASAIDDDVHEAASTGTFITTTTTSSSSVYDQLAVPPTSVRVYDDDAASVQVDAPDIIELDEARATRTVDVALRLTSQPKSAVTISATEAGGQVHLSHARLTFTPSNWSTTQRITVTVVDDQLVELHPHTATIQLHAASNDSDYGGLRLASRTVQIEDDDRVGVELTGVREWPATAVTPDRPMTAPVPLREGGATARVRIRLASAPASDLVVRPVLAPAEQLHVEPQSITIPAGTTLANGVEFNVSAVDDHIDETDVHAAAIAWELATSDGNYAGLTNVRTAVAITDDDTAGVRVTPSGAFDTVEGGPQRELAVSLDSAPTSPVVINLLPDAQATAVAKTSSLRFDHQTWNVPQTVAIAARDDDAAEGSPHAGLVAFDVASADPNYNDLAAAPIPLTIRDNDAPGVLVTATGADTRVVEGGARDMVNVRLRSRPVVPVTVTLSDASNQVQFPTGATITIEPNSWAREHLVELAAVQDDTLQGTRAVPVHVAVHSADASYASGAGALPQPVDVTVVDDEQPGFVVVQSGGDTAVTEAGGGDTYTVALAARPSADVTLTIQPDAQVRAAPGSLTFSPANWKAPQEISVHAVNDDLDEPESHTGTIRHGVQTTAAGWDMGAPVPEVGVRVLDDDNASIRFTATGDSTRVVEGGATDTISMVLTARPVGPVEVVAKPDERVTVEGTLAFGIEDWRTPRTLTIKAVDDESVDGERHATVGFVVRSADPGYKVQRIPPLDVLVVDDDVWKDEQQSQDDDGIVDPHADVEEAPDAPVAPAQPSAGPTDAGVDHGSAEPGSHEASDGSDAQSVPATGVDGQLVAGGATVAGSADETAEATLAATREPSGEEDPKRERERASALGRWARDHVALIAIAGGLLGLGGIGVGWLVLRNPTGMARRAGRGFGSDRLLP